MSETWIETASVADLLNMIDWYRQCLEDVNACRPVRGFDEAKHGYEAAMAELKRRNRVVL